MPYKDKAERQLYNRIYYKNKKKQQIKSNQSQPNIMDNFNKHDQLEFTDYIELPDDPPDFTDYIELPDDQPDFRDYIINDDDDLTPIEIIPIIHEQNDPIPIIHEQNDPIPITIPIKYDEFIPKKYKKHIPPKTYRYIYKCNKINAIKADDVHKHASPSYAFPKSYKHKNSYNQYEYDTDEEDELELIDTSIYHTIPRFIKHIPYDLLVKLTMRISNKLEETDTTELDRIINTANMLFGDDKSRIKTEFMYFELVCSLNH
jgi:hypothetical protein